MLCSGLLQVACKLVHTGLRVVLGDNRAAGVDEGIQRLTIELLDSGLDRQIAHVIGFLRNGHGLITGQNGLTSGLVAVEAEEDGVLVGRVALGRTGRRPRAG